jgi:hypothetical protein
MSVELREFVKKTLLDIVQGVADAQADPSIGAYVVPAGSTRKYVSVEFDVAVTAESAESAKGGSGVKVSVLAIGGTIGGEESALSKNIAATHVKFSVPVSLPEALGR